ncbi:hypothetical protein [Dubosiella muris]|uniref:Uncharacterized protein n=2 Tax=Dubosiella TaxID=1937008 RepID=A0AC61R5K1_9FIRM|nr:hypothetical protein [Dubosiella muris]TGY65104.1 hypothetical protein E5336_10395 [Dubosiella muris]
MQEKKKDGIDVTFEARGCRKMLQKNPSLQSKIVETLRRQAENDFFKSKYATRKRWHDLPVFECRVNDPSVGAVRIAFARQGERLFVLYGSTTLLKKSFTQELESFLKEG